MILTAGKVDAKNYHSKKKLFPKIKKNNTIDATPTCSKRIDPLKTVTAIYRCKCQILDIIC